MLNRWWWELIVDREVKVQIDCERKGLTSLRETVTTHFGSKKESIIFFLPPYLPPSLPFPLSLSLSLSLNHHHDDLLIVFRLLLSSNQLIIQLRLISWLRSFYELPFCWMFILIIWFSSKWIPCYHHHLHIVSLI